MITAHPARFSGFKKQNGAALIVAMVVLAVVTIIGISSIQSSSMQMKMITSTMDRNKAFAVAEAGLSGAENWLENIANLEQTDLYSNTCSGSRCFSSACDNGLCFDGTYDNSMSRIQCEVASNADSTERVTFWSDATLDVWDVDSKHRSIMVGVNEVKYVVEFLCFVAGTNGPFNALPGNQDNGDALFRVTAFLEGDGGLAPVMLQSTYTIEI